MANDSPRYSERFPHVSFDVNEVAIITGLRYAHSGKTITKNQAEALRTEYCTNLVNDLKEAGKIPASIHICNMQPWEEDCNLDRQIKYTKGRFRKSGTIFVTLQQTDGITLEIVDKTPLEKFIIEESVKTYHRTKVACPLLYEPQLYLDIWAIDEGPQVEAIIDGTYVCPDDPYPAVKNS